METLKIMQNSQKMPGFHISQRAVNSQKVNNIHGKCQVSIIISQRAINSQKENKIHGKCCDSQIKNSDVHDYIHLKSNMIYLFWIQATTNQIMVKPLQSHYLRNKNAHSRLLPT